jgi:hypothetical protein
VLWIERFDTLDEVRTAVRAFARTSGTTRFLAGSWPSGIA